MRALADNAAKTALFEPILIFGLFSLFSDLNGELNFEAELWNLLWGREMQGLIHNAGIARPLLSSNHQNLPSSPAVLMSSPWGWFWEIYILKGNPKDKDISWKFFRGLDISKISCFP